VSTKTTLDVAIGATAGGTGVSVLMDWIQSGAATVAAIGGAILVLLRLYYTIQDRRNGKRD
jgi:hypothetical protein